MTDNDLDLNDRKMLLKARKSGSDGTFQPPQKAKTRGKRVNERGKTRNFLIYFVKILVKTARKLG